MTADIRTAAQHHVNGQVTEYAREWFADGAVWAAALVTPTREQIEDALTSRSDQSDETGTTIKLDHARDAILALLQELAEGESDG